MKTFMFPGQGSQAKGMGGDLFEKFGEITQQADEILGYSIQELCLEDPKRVLNKTQYTQPALYVVNALSYFDEISRTGEKPDYVAGHSLGEFNALLAAECYDFATGLKLVQKRGLLMSQAGDGAMAAVLGGTKEKIRDVLDENKLTEIDIANYNTPSQIVLSGEKSQVVKAQLFFEAQGMRYVPLNTSGAFHSRFMQASKEEFEEYLRQFKFNSPKIPVIANITARAYKDTEVSANLAAQITGSVRWAESIQHLLGLGDMEFAEIGHGDVLTKLVAKIVEETPNDVVNRSGGQETTSSARQSANFQASEQSWSEIRASLDAAEKVKEWNKRFAIGQKVASVLIDDTNLMTRTEAMVLFGHRAAVYMEGYNGYFDLDEIELS